MSATLRTFCCGLIICISLVYADDGASARGRRPLDDGGNSRIGYRTKWALIIGINYDDPRRSARDQRVLPKLSNAEADARALRELLVSRYGYQPEHILYNESGSDATLDWIRDSLRKLCDSENVTAEDSVLFFFAGHGDRVENPHDPGALYPYDVQFRDSIPVPTTYIRMQSDLVDVLRQCPARHKLIILDSCYSGEVFNLGALPRSETDDRSALALAEQSCLQAMTSCRSSQVASDGGRGNSPFTRALLAALRQLPARHTDVDRVWSNWLFAYMRPQLKNMPNGQSPDCRNLAGDGEFGFFPDRQQDWSQELPSAVDYQMLQVSAGSEQGQWWFDEIPWFLPSVRESILNRIQSERSGLKSLRLNRDRLKDAARQWLAEIGRPVSGEANAGAQAEPEKLTLLRAKHLRWLLNDSERMSRDDVLQQIQKDLVAMPPEQLEPEDRHLLAVVQHKLDLPEAEQTYLDVLDAYCAAQPGGSVSSQHSGNVLLALCKADLGEYLLDHPSQHFGTDAIRKAAEFFRAASQECTWEGPASFNIFLRCREADAWIRLNQWAEGEEALRDALDLARAFTPNHADNYLTAYVHRRRAWAQMTRWNISEAEASFTASNRILANWMSASEDFENTAGTGDESLAGLAFSEAVRRSTDYEARIAFYHNLHGLAMAKRFLGRLHEARREYRAVAMELEDALGQLRHRPAVAREVEDQLLQRLVNTLERLADCNLFGHPDLRDISEAVDDYDRANSRIHLLEEKQWQKWRTRLAFKRALALALPSDVQNCELACALSDAAAEDYLKVRDTARGMDQALGELVPAMVDLLSASGAEVKSPGAAGLAETSTALREALLQYRRRVGANPHRDQLELCLFGADLLVRYGHAATQLTAREDVDLLLSFCRIPLAPYRRSGEYRSSFCDARRYLVPYYDTAVSTLLAFHPADSKKLLRLQWEATRGTVCPKPRIPVPVAAVYILPDQPCLIYSLPGGPSRVVKLGDSFSADEIVQASLGHLARLPLPRPAKEDFERWQNAQKAREGGHQIEVRLCQSVETPSSADNRPASESSGSEASAEATIQVSARKPIDPQFPFLLPDGFVPVLAEM